MSRDPCMTYDRFARSVELHPDWHASEHARALGITRERVRQLRIALDITLPKRRGGYGRHAGKCCSLCEEPTRNGALRHRRCMPPVTPERRAAQIDAAHQRWYAKIKAARLLVREGR